MPSFAHVALPLPVAMPYTYAIPDILADRIVPGARVVVPVRRRELVGIVVGVDDVPPAVAAKDILVAPDLEPALSGPLLKTAEWVAGYYGTPLGITLKAMLPAPLWGESEVFLSLRAGARIGGGTAGALVEWLERRGGRASIRMAARALKKPLWAVVDRLQRVDALTVEVEPAATAGNRATSRVLELLVRLNFSSETSGSSENPSNAPSTKLWSRPKEVWRWIRSAIGSK